MNPSKGAWKEPRLMMNQVQIDLWFKEMKTTKMGGNAGDTLLRNVNNIGKEIKGRGYSCFEGWTAEDIVEYTKYVAGGKYVTGFRTWGRLDLHVVVYTKYSPKLTPKFIADQLRYFKSKLSKDGGLKK